MAVGTVTAVAVADNSYPAYPAVLAGQAVLPARTLLVPPPAAPVELRTSGKYAKPPATGDFVWPFAGQPVQGHSAIRRADDGSFWLLTDNGAGGKANSPDFMLQLNRYRSTSTPASSPGCRPFSCAIHSRRLCSRSSPTGPPSGT